MILSGGEIARRILVDPAAKGWWRENLWDRIGRQVLVHPFDRDRVGVCGYEITVGEEYRSLRDPYNLRRLAPGESLEVGPGETVLILTEEFIGLPKTVLGLVVPRARRIFQGGLINATRLDPTWYGKLIVGFTNLAKFPNALTRGEPFCVCLLLETQEVERTLADERAEHLGREHLEVDFPNLRYRPPRAADSVTAADLNSIAELHGPPFDIIVGGFYQARAELLAQVERDVAPNLVRQAVSEARTGAWNWVVGLLGILIAGLLAVLGRAVNFF